MLGQILQWDPPGEVYLNQRFVDSRTYAPQEQKLWVEHQSYFSSAGL